MSANLYKKKETSVRKFPFFWFCKLFIQCSINYTTPRRSGLQKLLLEVTVVQTFECLAVAGFVASHFVYGVVNSVKIECLCTLC